MENRRKEVETKRRGKNGEEVKGLRKEGNGERRKREGELKMEEEGNGGRRGGEGLWRAS